MRALEDLVGEHGREVGFEPSAMLFREGEPADRFFILRRGAVALELAVPGRGPLVIETLGPGELVGLSWLSAPQRWQFDGRAVGPVDALVFDADEVHRACDADPELGYAVMLRLAAGMLTRLQATRLQLLDVYGHAGAR